MCVSQEFGGALRRGRAVTLIGFSFSSSRRIAALLGEDEGSALVELGARVRAGFLVPQDFLSVELAVVLRTIAEPLGVRVVVPAALVAGDPVHDLEADAGSVDRDRNELREIARRKPDREPPLVHRPRIDVAD